MFRTDHMYPYSFQIKGRGNEVLAQMPRPRFGKLGASRESLVERTSVDLPIDWVFLASSAASAAVSGAAIGYLSGGSPKTATTGAIAGAGIWAGIDATREMFLSRYALGAALGVGAAGALAYAWFRKP